MLLLLLLMRGWIEEFCFVLFFIFYSFQLLLLMVMMIAVVCELRSALPLWYGKVIVQKETEVNVAKVMEANFW